MLLLNASNVRLMTKDSTRSSDRNRLLRLSGLVLLLLGVSLLLYGWNLSHQIEKRFSGRRWNIPSKIFSDVTILYPGQSINRPLFHETLYRLGYWEVPNEPERKGEMCISRSLVELFLHDLEIPSRKREGFPVRIRFVDDRIERIEHLKTGEPIPILEVEPEEVALFFGPERERRQLISIEQVPQHVIHAILAAEDRNFYEHRGLDPWGILRALYTNVRHGSIRQGGSTITQQLAKNYFLTSERKLSRKLKELIKGPNYYSPYVDKKRSLSRRNLVLNALHKAGWISDEELRVAIDAPANTIGFRDYGKKAPYFIDYLSEQLTTLYAPYFIDYLSEQLTTLYPPESLASLGLSIYTTLDTQVQIAAESALRRGLERIEKTNPTLIRSDPRKKLQGAIVVLQPKTGYVLAMVGGRNYSVSQFNRASQARRQPGSAFKPFVYLSGLDQFTPTSMLSNKPRSYEMDGKAWEPHNYESVAKDRVSLREAITHSINLATVDLAMNIGLDHIVRVVASFHFSTPLEPYPSLSLGASEVIPLELARAYCAFAADGVLPYPFSLKAVVDENGKILERKHVAIERVISPAEAFIMSSMLRSVVRKGTARSLSKMGIFFPVAGKTGTTNDFRDGWFVGYTPDILALVWVGFDSGESIHATGSATALPIWADLMKAIPHWVSAEWFTMPPGVVKQTVCLHSGQLAVKNGCPDQMEELFLAIHVPTNYCPLHRRVGPLERVMKEVKDFFEKF
jgi:penicillin-binding protein 1B